MSRKFKSLIALVCAFILIFSLCINSSAIFIGGYKVPVLLSERCASVSVLWNGDYLCDGYERLGTTYVPAVEFLELLLGSPCVLKYKQPYSVINLKGEGFELCCYVDPGYITVNGRCVPLDGSPIKIDGLVCFPITSLTKVIGAELITGINGKYCNIKYTSGTPIPSANDVYNQSDLYWLSRVIFAESGTQPLEGMIGVGNVVLNRVESIRFPNSVYDVIFQKNQFSVVDCGMIYREPDERSIIAAKLCLEGADSVGESLYFINPALCNGSWFRNNLTFTHRIGEHDFFV